MGSATRMLGLNWLFAGTTQDVGGGLMGVLLVDPV